MEFYEFKQEVVGRDNKNKPKATIGFIRSLPAPDSENPGSWEYAIENVVTANKPELDLIYVTDPFGRAEFIKLNLKFLSSYDPDIANIFDFLAQFEADASIYYDEFENCPAMTVQIIPNDVFETKNMHYMELNMPMMIGLISSQQNKMPDTITMLFTLDNCSIHEEELISLEEVNKEIIKERMKEEEEARAAEEEMSAELERQRRMEELQRQMHQAEEPGTGNIRVGRVPNEADEDDE